jgi:hypothetical protein
MYKPDHFELRELLSEHYWKTMWPLYGDRLWQIFDERLLITMDRIRKRYLCPFIANTWFKNSLTIAYKYREWSGYRDHTSPDIEKEGSENYGNISQHRFGRAVDMLPTGLTAEEIRIDILNSPNHEDFKYITAIEKGVSWLHIDVRNHDKQAHGIKTFGKS